MSLNIKFTFDKAKAIAARGLNGSAQKRFTNRVRRYCDPFVPLDSGTLKNSAREFTDRIEYITPYAKKQYYENKGTGQRGSYWNRRMMAAKGRALLDETAADIGGKAR